MSWPMWCSGVARLKRELPDKGFSKPGGCSSMGCKIPVNVGAAAIEFIVTAVAGDSQRITWDDES